MSSVTTITRGEMEGLRFRLQFLAARRQKQLEEKIGRALISPGKPDRWRNDLRESIELPSPTFLKWPSPGLPHGFDRLWFDTHYVSNRRGFHEFVRLLIFHTSPMHAEEFFDAVDWPIGPTTYEEPYISAAMIRCDLHQSVLDFHLRKSGENCARLIAGRAHPSRAQNPYLLMLAF